MYRIEWKDSDGKWHFLQSIDYAYSTVEAAQNWLDRTGRSGNRYRIVPVSSEPAPANPKQAYGDLKAAVQFVPPALWLAAARGNGEGARKYGAFNWRTTKVEALTYVGAMMRHLAAWIDGEEIDPESKEGKHHLDGVAASLAILLDALHGGFLIDNRPPKGPAPNMVLTPKNIEHDASFHMGQPK